MPTASATGGAAKGKKKSKKTTTKKTTTKKAEGHSLEYYKKKAKALGVPLSKDGKSKTKTQLRTAIAYRESHK